MPDIVGDGDNLGNHIATKGFKQIKGADIASADAITFGTDGNTFDITGTTTINHFNTTNWEIGSIIVLHFDGAVALTHNVGSLSGVESNILLSGDSTYTTTAGDILTFVRHDSTNWQEIARNSGTIDAVGDIGDVTISGIGSGEILKWNGSAWVNQTLAEAGIVDGNLGTPSALVGTNISGTAANLTAGNATLAATSTALATARTIGGVSFDGTANINLREVILLACSDETTDLTTGTGKVTFRCPFAFTITGVSASVTTAPVGSTIIIDINEAGSTCLSTKLSIDASEKTSTTAASAAVISDANIAADAEITVDIDQIGSSTAGAGLKVKLDGYRTA